MVRSSRALASDMARIIPILFELSVPDREYDTAPGVHNQKTYILADPRQKGEIGSFGGASIILSIRKPGNSSIEYSPLESADSEEKIRKNRDVKAQGLSPVLTWRRVTSI